MRCFLVITVWGFAGALELSAQPRIGVALGVGVASVSLATKPDPYGSSTSSEGSKAGVVVGVFAQVPLQKGLCFQPGVYLTTKGYKRKSTSSSPYGSYTFTSTENLSYLDVPLNIVYSSKPNGDGFRFGGGPVVGFPVHPQFDGLTKTDFGANVFAGYQTPIGFWVSLGYTHGFSNVARKEYTVTSLKNRFAALTIGYLF